MSCDRNRCKVTGLVTFFNLVGDLSSDKIRENDIISAGTERVKVLNVDNDILE